MISLAVWARAAVSVEWLFTTIAAMPSRFASSAAEMAVTLRGKMSGAVWMCRSTVPLRRAGSGGE